MKKEKFEDYLTRKNDVIDNAAHRLAAALVALRGDFENAELKWDISCIGEIVDSAERILNQNGLQSCHPYYDDNERPCYLDVGCGQMDCPFR